MKKNILLLHGINYWNIGDLGITDAMISLFYKKYSQADITVLSPYYYWKKPIHSDLEHVVEEKPDYFLFPQKEKFSSIWGKILFLFQFFWKLLRISLFLILFRIFSKPICSLVTNTEEETLQKYLSADVVVSKGGGFLFDHGRFLLSPHAFPLIIALTLKKPVIIYSQTIGPFKRKLSSWTYKKIFEKVDHIIVREEESLEVLQKMNIPHISLGMDAAFTLEPTEKEGEKEKIDSITTEKRKTHPLLVGMSFVVWHFPYQQKEERKKFYQKYIHSLATEIKRLQKEKNAFFFFFPHSIEGMEKDDHEAIQESINKSEIPPDHYQIVQTEHNPRVLSYFLGKLDMCIGTRMHSNIFTLRGETPLIAISYLPKTTGIMKLFDLSEYVIPIEAITPEILRKKTDALLENKSQIIDKIFQKKIEAQKKAEENAEKLDIYLKS